MNDETAYQLPYQREVAISAQGNALGSSPVPPGSSSKEKGPALASHATKSIRQPVLSVSFTVKRPSEEQEEDRPPELKLPAPKGLTQVYWNLPPRDGHGDLSPSIDSKTRNQKTPNQLSQSFVNLQDVLKKQRPKLLIDPHATIGYKSLAHGSIKYFQRASSGQPRSRKSILQANKDIEGHYEPKKPRQIKIFKKVFKNLDRAVQHQD